MAAKAETKKAPQRPFEVDEKSGSAGLAIYRRGWPDGSDIFFLSLAGTGFEASCVMTPDDLRELRRWINAEIGEDEDA